MRRVEERAATLRKVAAEAGLPMSNVGHVVTALRDAIDGLFLDGYTIFAPPFSLTYRDNPVASIFAERIFNATDSEVDAWYEGDVEASASWLDVPLATYLRHPVASELHVLAKLLDALHIDDPDGPDGQAAVVVARAWFETFIGERPYRLSHVGLERDLEAWLVHNPERLVEIGYDARLRRQQLVLPDRRRPDLVFDLDEDDGARGTLIVELKATSGYLGAVDQLAGYMDAFTSLGPADGPVRGLLVADGFPPEVLTYADEQGIDTATLTELGYRRDLADPHTAPFPPTRALPAQTEEFNVIDTGSPEPAAPCFILAWGKSAYDPAAYETDAPEPVPFLRVTAPSLSDPVQSIEPMGTSGWEYEAALEMRPEGWTPRQLARFFGSSCYLQFGNPEAEHASATSVHEPRIDINEVGDAQGRATRRVKRRD